MMLAMRILLIILNLFLGLSCKAQETSMQEFAKSLNHTYSSVKTKESKNIRKFFKKAERHIPGYSVDGALIQIPIYTVCAKKNLNPAKVAIDSVYSCLNPKKLYLRYVLSSLKNKKIEIYQKYWNLDGRFYARIPSNFFSLYDSVKPDVVLKIFDMFYAFVKEDKVLWLDTRKNEKGECELKLCSIHDIFPTKDLVWGACLHYTKPSHVVYSN